MRIKVIYKECDVCRGKGYNIAPKGMFREDERKANCPSCKGRGHKDEIDSLDIPDEEFMKLITRAVLETIP